MEVGYIRVSSVDQNTDRQLDGLELEKVFQEKISGTTRDRPELNRCIEFLREGCNLHVYEFDDVANSLPRLISFISLVLSKGVALSFVKEDFCIFPSEYQHIERLNQFHKDKLKVAQREGREKAKTKGKTIGRPIVTGKLI